MRKIREIMRLRYDCGWIHLKIAKSLQISESTVSECLKRIKEAGLSWPLPSDFTDEFLEAKLYPPAVGKIKEEKRGILDWDYVHKELRRKSVTLRLLWEEYKERYPEGIRYSQYCNIYRDWSKKLDVWMHQSHKAGEKLFVDYAGQTVPIIIDKETGAVKEAQIFIAVLGASNCTFIEATWTQTLPDWVQSHIHAFEFFQGCPEILVPDNLKSGVKKSHLYEPDLNSTYQDMATHYGVGIVPARAKSPKDKAKVEQGVKIVEMQILAKLRNRTFWSLAELNQDLVFLLEKLNQQPFQKLQGSRFSQFQELDKPALKPLPAARYQYAEWKKCRVGFNYHIEIEKHFYSVHFTFVKKRVDVRYSGRIVEVFYENQRIASHIRSYIANGYTTLALHMPQKHQYQAKWNSERIVTWAKGTGPKTAQFVQALMASKLHPQQAFRPCIGIISLAKKYGKDRLEAACHRALLLGVHTYKSVESILKNNLEIQPLQPHVCDQPAPQSHEYVRGHQYFH